MAKAGSLWYDTKIDNSGFKKGTQEMGASSVALGNIVADAFGKIASVINDSMGTAVKRLDTMSNFPKVMKNLGISAEDSQKSIDLLGEKLVGIPTTLDSAAMAVQRFTSKNGDVKKSTDLFLAVNDAILAGGAGADIQSTAMEQLAQAYSKGKMDMVEWRSLQTAMPAQLKQVAQAMGLSVDELGEMMRQGDMTEETMEQFLQTIVSLDQEGQNGFPSLAEQARNATGGIETSFTNMKTRIAKGLADVIESINQVLSDEGLGGISGVMETVGNKAKEILQWVAKNMPKIVKVLKTIAPLIVGIITALLVFKTVTGVITAVSTAMGILNAVMAMNPILLIVMAIAGLVAAFIYLWKTSDKFRNFWSNLWDGIVSIVTTVINTIITVFNTVINFFKNNWSTILLFIMNPFAGAFKYLYEHNEKFRNFVNNFVNTIKNFFVNMVSAIFNTVTSLPNKMINIGKNIVKGIWNGINNARQWLLNKIGEFVGGITKGFKKLLGIHSPSRVFRDIAKWIPRGVAVGIEANTDDAVKSVESMSDEMYNSMKKSVALETGNISANANVSANHRYNNTIVVNSTIDSTVEMDRQKVGRIITPVVTQTIKSGGGR